MALFQEWTMMKLTPGNGTRKFWKAEKLANGQSLLNMTPLSKLCEIASSRTTSRETSFVYSFLSCRLTKINWTSFKVEYLECSCNEHTNARRTQNAIKDYVWTHVTWMNWILRSKYISADYMTLRDTASMIVSRSQFTRYRKIHEESFRPIRLSA